MMKSNPEPQEKAAPKEIVLTPEQLKKVIIASREQGFLLAFSYLRGKVKPA